MRNLCIFALLSLPALAQYPYPGGGYPGGGYPGGGMGIPFPNIHLPSHKPKTDGGNGSNKITVRSAEGTLRHRDEKELLLQLSSGKVVRFQVLARTEFLAKDGKSIIADSQFHPGDKVTVDVNPDDLETALHVILIKSGNDSDKEKAGYEVEESRIMTPDAGDFGKTHLVNDPDAAGGPDPRGSVSSSSRSSSSDSSDTERPRLARNDAPAAAPAPTPERAPASALPPDNSTDAIIADAHTAASNFSAGLPNFLVQQITTRYSGTRNSEKFRVMDTVTADVASVNGKEEYRNIKVNGKPTDRPEDSGSWSTGEFQVTLEDILSPRTNATFTPRGSDRIRNRDAWVFDLAVDQPHSHWTIMDDRDRKIKPAYKGTIWIDKESRRVLRIEQEAINIPRDFAFDTNSSSLEYGFFDIDGHSYLLPANSVNEACGTGTSSCSRNIIQFKNYRKFSADSSVTFQ